MTIKRFEVNPLGQNTYVLSHDGQAAIIDCGALFEGEEMNIARYLKDEGLQPTHLLLTHAHFDHACGVPFIWHVFGLAPHLSADDLWLYNTMAQQIKQFLNADIQFDMPVPAGYLRDGDQISVGGLKFNVISTPGHTPGGLSYYCPEQDIIFTGDSLFNGSIGRTDFERGNYDHLIQSLTSKVLTLPPHTTVYPGHGPSTTIAQEKQYNPYLS